MLQVGSNQCGNILLDFKSKILNIDSNGVKCHLGIFIPFQICAHSEAKPVPNGFAKSLCFTMLLVEAGEEMECGVYKHCIHMGVGYHFD